MQIRISSDKERQGIILGYYSEELETEMLKFYSSVREKDQRRYAAIEAKKLGHGGIKYISELFGCHRNTITEGKNEIEKTSTKTGLNVVVNLMDKVYAKGREVADGSKENLPIIFDGYLPKWNYRAIPQNN
ncbi:hypothetical protein H6F44_20095 [Pseudanabaena sp. FACHB-1277]|uniref:Transposase n=1 Tax=Pseudanabaena cinerea FACHB-1277 TaxID=2949581 RepID=A0A926UWD8_9CYAN|nr:hypothetical protein [Pseudanabaena cinerea]MBD2152400.1 hypothetical protein [Pseudanabaena cinerea FACHB-1277]